MIYNFVQLESGSASNPFQMAWIGMRHVVEQMKRDHSESTLEILTAGVVVTRFVASISVKCFDSVDSYRVGQFRERHQWFRECFEAWSYASSWRLSQIMAMASCYSREEKFGSTEWAFCASCSRKYRDKKKWKEERRCDDSLLQLLLLLVLLLCVTPWEQLCICFSDHFQTKKRIVFFSRFLFHKSLGGSFDPIFFRNIGGDTFACSLA
jgi:hypothetical protein